MVYVHPFSLRVRRQCKSDVLPVESYHPLGGGHGICFFRIPFDRMRKYKHCIIQSRLHKLRDLLEISLFALFGVNTYRSIQPKFLSDEYFIELKRIVLDDFLAH